MGEGGSGEEDAGGGGGGDDCAGNDWSSDSIGLHGCMVTLTGDVFLSL